jgi:EAL domain-containing protein (putative c-di-GMP-specific phosphodiesterase class I)
MGDVDRTAQVAHRLQALGVQVAVDDFGTGPASLGSLARLPIDVVKIDQHVVHRVEREPVDQAIVTAAVAMAHAVGFRTVAEGVETAAQVEMVERLGCEVAQGHFFARSMSPAAFSRMLTVDTAATHGAPTELQLLRSARAG